MLGAKGGTIPNYNKKICQAHPKAGARLTVNTLQSKEPSSALVVSQRWNGTHSPKNRFQQETARYFKVDFPDQESTTLRAVLRSWTSLLRRACQLSQDIGPFQPGLTAHPQESRDRWKRHNCHDMKLYFYRKRKKSLQGRQTYKPETWKVVARAWASQNYRTCLSSYHLKTPTQQG